MHGLETIIAMNAAATQKGVAEKVTDLAEQVRNFNGKLSNIAWALDEAARNARMGVADTGALKDALAVAETTLHDLRVDDVIARFAKGAK